MLILQWTVFAFVLLIVTFITIVGLRFQRGKGKFLCADCRFSNEIDCHRKERPHALICTSYRQTKLQASLPVHSPDSERLAP